VLKCHFNGKTCRCRAVHNTSVAAQPCHAEGVLFVPADAKLTVFAPVNAAFKRVKGLDALLKVRWTTLMHISSVVRIDTQCSSPCAGVGGVPPAFASHAFVRMYVYWNSA
jgi:hypothetical protein